MAHECCLCRRRFASEEAVYRHNEAEVERCFLCGDFFCELADLHGHQVQHGLTRSELDSMEQLRCDDCDRNFGSAQALSRHRNSAVHQAHRCGNCNRVFGSAAALHQHVNSGIHSAHRCNGCDLAFDTADELSQHVNSGIHPPSRVQCVVCNRSFGSVQALNQHSNSASHLAHQCDQCSRSFNTAEGLAQHCNSIHQSHRCDNCDDIFDSVSDLIEHLCAYQPEPPVEEYRCHCCDYVFSTLVSLEMHQEIERRWQQTNRLRFECYLCDREFGSQHSLDQHTIDSPVHRRRRYRCHECDEGFLSADALELHRNDTSVHPRDHSRPLSPIRMFTESGPVRTGMDAVTHHMGAMTLSLANRPRFLHELNLAEMSDFSDEESFFNYQAHGFPQSFGTTTSPSTDATAESAEPTGQADSTSNQGVGPSRNLDSLAVADPATEDSQTDPVVLDSEPASSEPSDPEQQLKAEREKVAILTRDLLAAREALKKEKVHRQCGMCYEKSTDTVTKCGHLFCGGCIASWQSQHDHPFQAPCPMCRKAMGKTIKIFTD